MLSDVSDLTELSSSDDNYGKPTKNSQSSKKTGYRLRNVLKPGRTTQYTAKALYDQIHDGDIDLDPEYQRDIVWSDAKQIGLVDSIFRNFYVPPIIFGTITYTARHFLDLFTTGYSPAVTTEDDGTEKRVCIDGKQRLTSIQKFIGGLIPHRDPFTNEKLWFVDSNSGPKRKLLPPQYKTLFQNKQIVCIEYSDLPPDFEREVFQRVQMGMALTTAEKFQAISGPWPDLVREITKAYYLGKDGLSVNIDLNKSRARDFQNLAHTLFCIDQLPEYVQGTTMQVEKWLAQTAGPSEATRAKIHDTFRIYRDLAKDRQLKAPFKKPLRVAPVEFIMIGVLIASHKETHSLPQLSEAIGILRTGTRDVHEDVRGNAKVFKTMFNVISKKVKATALKSTVGKPTADTNYKSGKRKRELDSNGESSDDDHGGGDDEEYRPKTAKIRVAPSHPTGQSPTPATNHATEVPSGPSHVKIEEARPKMLHNNLTKPASTEPPTGPGRFAKLQAAKAKAANIVNGSSSGQPPTPTSAVASNLQPPRHLPLPPHPGLLPPNDPNPSLEAAMMGSLVPQTYTPMPNPLPNPPPPFQPPAPAQPAPRNDSTMHTGIPIPFHKNGHRDYQPPSAGASRSVYSNDNYRQKHSAESSRDERSDGGGYRGARHGYNERRDRDPDRDYPDKDRSTVRDRNYDYDSRFRGSYSSRGAEYYKQPRDNGWDRRTDRDSRDFRRGSGYKDR